MANYKGSFKTGWNQREIHADMKVATAAKVGTLCSIGTDTLTPLTAAPAANTKYAMIAQSDDTLGGGHIPVEHRDWQYSDEVAASTSATKHVAYYIVTLDDVTYASYT